MQVFYFKTQMNFELAGDSSRVARFVYRLAIDVEYEAQLLFFNAKFEINADLGRCKAINPMDYVCILAIARLNIAFQENGLCQID